MDPACEPSSLPFALLLSIENMGLPLYLFMFMRFLLLFSSFYLMVIDSSSSMQQPLCNDRESSALLQFKQSFLIDKDASEDPFAYPKIGTWKSHGEEEGEGSDCCSWDGVECDRETGHVIGLHLASSCLYGSLNSNNTLFSLSHLKRLDLSDNHFNYSKIPFGVGQLSRLRSLILSESHFSGQIPSELLALSKLVFLDLSGNPMLELQKPSLRNLVQNLTHLKNLHLSQVNISATIPHALANLSSLTSLFLRECGLHGEFPNTIFQLPSLQFLSVRFNPNLTGYLPEFQETSPLKMLFLRGTSFSGELPASIGRLGSLTELDIGSCNFTGLVPSSLDHLTQLSVLDLSFNFFSRPIPPSLANLTTITFLGLFSSNLNGEIPSFFANMSELTFLGLSDNQLSGQIPSWLMNLTQLTELHLDRNSLEGPIPSSLFELVNLQYLYLQYNYLNGTVGLHKLSKLKNLAYLQLSRNRLSLLSDTRTNSTLPKFKILGLDACNITKIPAFLQNQGELEVLFLANNKIHGPIPKWMWNISKQSLEILELSYNFLTGFEQLPAVLPWSRMKVLGLRSNMLQGSLPVPPPSTLQYSVSGNKLDGEIPLLICNLTYLKSLDLSGNNFSGRIPQCLTSLSSSLSVLNLRGNNLHGAIPQICTNTSNLQVIDLSENQLRGKIPRSLANCMTLEHLVLGNNQIDDIFPFWLGALPQLQVLSLRSNRFHGAIGSWHSNFRFPKLHIIDLSDNEFIGDLPSEYFQNWDAMRILDSDQLSHIQATVLQFAIEYTRNAGLTEEGIGFPRDAHIKMMIKGMLREYKNIADNLICIDLSSNKFDGEIPEAIGGLVGLYSLNLSNNDLTGPIPSSLANLTMLEAMDLSENKLLGEIPQQLTQLTFLADFNVSHNHLTGPIPEGKQFNTFSNSSFDGNPGLCGYPLSRVCGSSEGWSLTPPPSTFGNACPSDFDWKFVLMGYGSGLVIGVSIGYCLTVWKHEWFVKTFGRQRRKLKRTNRRGNRE